VIVRLDEREVCACPKCDAEMVRAPLGDKVVVGGAYGSQLVASLVVGKYADGLPLYRQHEILKRLGFDMPSSSMADQITWSTDLLAPIWRGLIEVARASLLLHVDATSMPVRDKETKGAVHLGALWGYVGSDADGPLCAVYLFTSTGKKVGQRDGEIGPEEFLLDREGFVVADAPERVRRQLRARGPHRGRLQHARTTLLRESVRGGRQTRSPGHRGVPRNL